MDLDETSGAPGDGVDVQQPRSMSAFDAAELGAWEWNPQRDRWSWDRRVAVLLGLPERAAGYSSSEVLDVIDRRDKPALRGAVDAASRLRGLFEVAFRISGPVGAPIWLSARGQAMHDSQGQMTHLLGVLAEAPPSRAAEESAIQNTSSLAGLVRIAQDLGEAGSEEDVLKVVTDSGTPLLGARAMGLAILSEDGHSVRTLSTAFDADYLEAVAVLPATLRLPLVDTAVTGAPHYLSDLASTTQSFPDALDLYLSTGVDASAAVPLRRRRGAVFGSLSIAYAGPHQWAPEEKELLSAFAVLTSQALQRIYSFQAEKTSHEVASSFAETFQRSLLTRPLHSQDLKIAVRYVPAAASAQVGGDWYDAFVTNSGVSTMVIGDVAGHDRHAAASMAQLRNMLRGVCFIIERPPGEVLSDLDAAMASFGVEATGTATIIQVLPASTDPDPSGRPANSAAGEQEHRSPHLRRLLWSNAGHPPPLLITSDGQTRFLETEPDLMLGVLPGTKRHTHSEHMAPGDTLLLYTDGLVERRGSRLQDGLAWLRNWAADHSNTPIEMMCDQLLIDVGRVADDVALLAVRALE